MKERASKKPQAPTPYERRMGVLTQLLNQAEFMLKRSDDPEEQSEALECKKLLLNRREALEPISAAA